MTPQALNCSTGQRSTPTTTQVQSKRYTIALAVGIVTEDEQLAANFSDLFLKAGERIANELVKDEMFVGKLELFPIMPGEDDVPQ